MMVPQAKFLLDTIGGQGSLTSFLPQIDAHLFFFVHQFFQDNIVETREHVGRTLLYNRNVYNSL